jgi:uncharacterized membrane protein
MTAGQRGFASARMHRHQSSAAKSLVRQWWRFKTPSMTNLVAASLFLLLSHFLIASTQIRGILVAKLGEPVYSTSYSVLAVAAFAWLITAYNRSPDLLVWTAPRWLGIALAPLLLLSSVLIVAGLTTPNPVILRSAHLFQGSSVVRGVLRISRNPFFWGTSLLSISLIVVIGSLASIVAFGSITFLGIVGGKVLDAKKAKQHGAVWRRFAAETSDVPFMAIIEKRQTLALAEIRWWRWSAAGGLFFVVMAFLITRSNGS